MRDLGKLVALAERAAAMVGPQNEQPGTLTVSAAASGRTTVRVYGYIGSTWLDEGVTAASFAKELERIGKDGIDLHINSGGGSAFDAIAMHAALLNHPSDVVSYVDGIAASAASFLAQAGDERVIEKPARFMIHNAASGIWGNKAELREAADLLEEIDASIAEMYADRAGKPAAAFAAAMDAETWYGSAEAVKAGLADRVANDKTAAPEDRRTQLIRARARVALRGASAHH